MNQRPLLWVVAATISLVLSSGCAMQRAAVRLAPASVYRLTEAGLSAEDEQRVRDNCPLGMPVPDPQWPFGPTEHVFRDGYVLQHSSQDKIPLWVCEGVSREQLEGDLKRSNKFQPDPLLKPGKRSELSDYKSSSYDRGHQAPAGDQTLDERLKEETFYLSNMAPQVPAFNQQIWAALEEAVRRWVEDRGRAFVITGGLFYDPAEDDPGTADGFVDYSLIGKNVAVPTHFYKIVVARDVGGAWQAIGFVIENRKFSKPYDFGEFIRSIDWIEQHAGLNFMPELDGDPLEEERLEREKATLW